MRVGRSPAIAATNPGSGNRRIGIGVAWIWIA
jgi:hypothetical protein